MAVFEDVRLVLQVMAFVDNYRKSLRFEAQSYINTLNAGTVIVNGVPTAATTVVQDIILKDRVQFNTMATRYTNLVATSSSRAQLSNGLTVLQISSSETQALINTLGVATSGLNNAPIATSSQIINMATSILAIVPTFLSINPEV